jgi:hypothetical protein
MPTEYACQVCIVCLEDPSLAHLPVQNFNGGAQCSRDETWSFHQRIKGWMDSTPWVPNYFPFGQLVLY